MRPPYPFDLFEQRVQADVIDISSDDDEDLEVNNQEIISVSSDSNDTEMDDPEDPEQEELDILADLEVPEAQDQVEPDIIADLEDGQVQEVGDVPTVANQFRIGFWRDGFFCTPGNWRNYGREEGYGVWSLNEPPMDGVVGGLAHVGERTSNRETLGGLLYNQWLQNKDRPLVEQITLGESMYNHWLEGMD